MLQLPDRDFPVHLGEAQSCNQHIRGTSGRWRSSSVCSSSCSSSAWCWARPLADARLARGRARGGRPLHMSSTHAYVTTA